MTQKKNYKSNSRVVVKYSKNKHKYVYFYSNLSLKSKKLNFNLNNFFKNKNKTKKHFFFSKKEYLLTLINNPLLFKKEFFFSFTYKSFVRFSYIGFFSNLINSYLFKTFTNVESKKHSFFMKNDLDLLISTGNVMINSKSFLFYFKRYVTQSFDYKKLNSFHAFYPYQTIIKFIEYCSGKKTLLKVDPFIIKNLSVSENTRCFMWSLRLRAFRKILGHRLFLTESLQIILLVFKLKDPYLLSNWMLSMFYKISFWKYKMLLRYMQYILKYLFWPSFKHLNVKGLKFQLKGKVSVAGNARKRTVMTKIGSISHATFKFRVLTNLSLIRTFTGVIGFRTWLVF